MPSNTSSGAARHAGRTFPASQQPGPGARPDDLDDDLLAAVLIRMWTLASGRSLRRDVPPAQLSEEELIDFWADDMNPPTGRHVRSGTPDRMANTREPSTKDRQPRRRHRRRDSRHTSGNAGSVKERSAA